GGKWEWSASVVNEKGEIRATAAKTIFQREKSDVWQIAGQKHLIDIHMHPSRTIDMFTGSGFSINDIAHGYVTRTEQRLTFRNSKAEEQFIPAKTNAANDEFWGGAIRYRNSSKEAFQNYGGTHQDVLHENPLLASFAKN